jgi:hypothetical protein
MNCISCNWKGTRSDLLELPSTNLSTTNWCLCPNCKTKIDVISNTTISTTYNGSVITISRPKELSLFFRKNPQVHIHLKRILNFSISQNSIKIIGFKNYSNQVFSLNIDLENEFESTLVLELIHRAHSQKYCCTSKSLFVNSKQYTLCGKWSNFISSIYPFEPCSFCARFKEWKNSNLNCWPLSTEKLQQLQTKNIQELIRINSTYTNNKFAKIFLQKDSIKEEQQEICFCNEISSKPNYLCKIHSNENNIS